MHAQRCLRITTPAGVGYKRREMGDLQRYSVTKGAWLETAAEGGESASLTGRPAPRSGHVATAIGPNTMLLHGGWNGVSAYTDAWLLDTLWLRWTPVSTGSYAPGQELALPLRWNAAAVCVQAVPYPQVFVFGGSGVLPDGSEAAPGSASVPSTGRDGPSSGGTKSVSLSTTKPEGSFLSDIRVLDTGTWTWRDLTQVAAAASSSRGAAVDNASSTGTKHITAAAPVQSPAAASALVPVPKPRADASLVYDAAGKRLLLWGGWANRWLGDAWALPVATVVGPPYCITSLSPTLGPLTGEQALVITGQGFEKGVPVTVRFALSGSSGRKFVDATGTCTSTTTIELSTPNGDHVGAGVMDVRVSIKGQAFTITSAPYTYFAVTSGPRSFAFGPGVLLNGNRVAVPTLFAIQARDTASHDRLTGGDQWHVSVTTVPSAAAAAAHHGRAPAAVPMDVKVTDSGDGRYIVAFTPTTAGAWGGTNTSAPVGSPFPNSPL